MITRFFQTRPAALPRDFRQLLLALGKSRDVDFDAFLDRFDYTGVTPHQVYAAALSRLPETAQVAVASPTYSARAHIGQMLRSREFQEQLMTRVARAFPERQRLVFVHVPKCAGTSFAEHLTTIAPSLSQHDQEAGLVPYERLPIRLQELMTGFRRHSTLALMGHIGLDWLHRERLLRNGDRTFSILREPLALVLSQVNFTLSQLLGRGPNPAAHIPPWMDRLGLTGFPTEMGALEAKETGRRFLRDARIVPDNLMCRYLGRGDATSALDLCASCDAELTTVSRYPQWLKARWGIASHSHLNASRSYLRLEDLNSGDLAHIDAITQEDQRLHARLEERLARNGRLSISGVALAGPST